MKPRLRRIVRWTVIAVPLVAVAAFAVAYFTSDNACSEPKRPVRDPMKAIVYCDYGTSEVLRLEEVEKPVLAEGRVLVRVRAASVNPLDWHFMRGTPYLMRMGTGLRRPKDTRLGVDFAGTVEAVGSKVTRFKPGDSVFGGADGAFGEYVSVREAGAIAKVPDGVSFEQAAAVPIAGLTALQGLRRGGAKAGEKVLVNGASGGVGTFAVQLAKVLGCNVTGVCSTRNLEMVRGLGADRTIDYTKEDFTAGTERYDLVLDNVGNRSLSECRRVLAPEGRYFLIGGGGPNASPVIGPFGRLLHTAIVKPFVSQRLEFFIAKLDAKDLEEIAELIRSGKVTPVIDRRYPLAELSAAIAYLEQGHARGKVIITNE
ncbi:MAG TPA: NAD(P)-dependent alcohol dehydrogenase [Candidatus Polarisedimenticolaceae bacterium]|nr:NAD(P)-dependent alcohol dehydrogenase [Candidatus Polarisedimenticolaceae bacterium]